MDFIEKNAELEHRIPQQSENQCEHLKLLQKFYSNKQTLINKDIKINIITNSRKGERALIILKREPKPKRQTKIQSRNHCRITKETIRWPKLHNEPTISMEISGKRLLIN